MPLRVPSCGQPGYWFHPAWTIAENTKFELIVEGRLGEVRPKYIEGLQQLINSITTSGPI